MRLGLFLDLVGQGAGLFEPTATMALDFTTGRYRVGAGGNSTPDFASLPNLTVTRATPSVAYGTTSGGVLVPFAANVARITDQGLLVEEARTNLLLWSADPSNAAWTKSGAQTVVANAVSAPDGATTAATVTSNSADPQIYEQITASASTAYTGTVWLKVPSGTLNTKLQLTDQTGATLGTALTVALTTSWQRFTVTASTGGAATGLRLAIGGFSTLPSTTVFHQWGAQVEQAAFPTSYIPTTSASVTRAADLVGIGGITGPSAGTWVAEWLASASSTARVAAYTDSGGSYGSPQGMIITQASSSSVSWGGNATSVANNGLSLVSGTTAVKSAGMFNVTGTLQRLSTQGSVVSANATLDYTGVGTARIQLGSLNSSGSQLLNSYLRRLVIYPRAFSDAELIAAST